MANHRKIDRLTPAQELRFAQTHAHWRAIGLSTDAADHNRAEAAVREIYHAAGLSSPKRIVWCGSPYAMGMARAIVCDSPFQSDITRTIWNSIANCSGDGIRDDVKAAFSASMRIVDGAGVRRGIEAGLRRGLADGINSRIRQDVGEGVRESIRQLVWDCVLESIWKGLEHGIRRCGPRKDMQQSVAEAMVESIEGSIGGCVKQKVWNDVRDVAWSRIGASVGGRVRTGVWDALWAGIQGSVWDRIAIHIVNSLRGGAFDSVVASGYGQHDAHWLAFYAYFRDVGGLADETENLVGLMDLAKYAGWFLPHEQVCWIAERPCVLSVDEEGRLHASEGPALVYPDGWSVHALHGVLVSANEAGSNAAAASGARPLVAAPG